MYKSWFSQFVFFRPGFVPQRMCEGYQSNAEPDVTSKYRETWVYFMEKMGKFFESLEFPFKSSQPSVHFYL